MIADKIIDVMGRLTEQQKISVIQVGLETIWQASVINTLGHTTIKGHCYYIEDDSPLLIHAILNTLNGSVSNQERLTDAVVRGVFRPVFDALDSEKRRQ